MTKKIDIHKAVQSYESAKERLSQRLSKENFQLVSTFLEDCENGRTGQVVHEHRALRYIADLLKLADYFQKPFDEVDEEDCKKFYSALKSGKFCRNDGKQYERNTRIEFVRTMKKFFKWLYRKDTQKFQELVGWMHRDFGREEDPAASITIDEVERIAESCKSMHKALMWVLFDGGLRAEELLNVRIKHVLRDDPKGYLKLRIEHSKTKARTISIPLATPHLSVWLSQHPSKDNLEAQLFPLTYEGLRKFVERVGDQVLKKHITPHLMRHSSATYYAHLLRNPYKMNYRYGWATASDMAQTYIDREGLEEEETAQIVETNQMSKLQKEIEALKQQAEHRKQADSIMASLLEDADIQALLIKKLKEKSMVQKIKAAL